MTSLNTPTYWGPYCAVTGKSHSIIHLSSMCNDCTLRNPSYGPGNTLSLSQNLYENPTPQGSQQTPLVIDSSSSLPDRKIPSEASQQRSKSIATAQQLSGLMDPHAGALSNRRNFNLQSMSQKGVAKKVKEQELGCRAFVSLFIENCEFDMRDGIEYSRLTVGIQEIGKFHLCYY